MAVKSIIEIDVDDASFKAFSQTFAKYQAQLAKMPAVWANTTIQIKGTKAAQQQLLGQQVVGQQQQAAAARAAAAASRAMQFQSGQWRLAAASAKQFAGH